MLEVHQVFTLQLERNLEDLLELTQFKNTQWRILREECAPMQVLIVMHERG